MAYMRISNSRMLKGYLYVVTEYSELGNEASAGKETWTGRRQCKVGIGLLIYGVS